MRCLMHVLSQYIHEFVQPLADLPYRDARTRQLRDIHADLRSR